MSLGDVGDMEPSTSSPEATSRHHRRVVALLIGIALIAGVTIAAAMSGPDTPRLISHGATTEAAPVASTEAPTQTEPVALSDAPAVPGPGHAYLGASVNPDHAAPSAKAAEAAAFDSQIGAHLAILHDYVAFQGLQSASAVRSALDPIRLLGAIPLVDWRCPTAAGATNGTEFRAVVDRTAQAVKAYGGPVFIRYGWEMNETGKGTGCAGFRGGPARYVAMWKDVVGAFRAANATNVSFVWCPGGSRANWAAYFPGSAWVDWIGIDNYDHAGTGAAAVTKNFGTFYQAFVGYSKPMMIGETGAEGADQAAYIGGLGQVLPVSFPQIKALVYFDAPGPHGAWAIAPGSSSMAAFASLAHDPYFTV